MAQSRRKFDEDFKQGAVRLVRETGKPIAQVARELGINEGTLGNWCAWTAARAKARWRRASGKSCDGCARRTPSCGCGVTCSSAAQPSGPGMR
jgi:transposase-like protein